MAVKTAAHTQNSNTQQGHLTLERRRMIADLLAREGSLRVADISQRFGVSEVTIRKDLEAMAADGLLVRSHGGAVAKTYTPLSTDFDLRAQQNLDQKQRIARAALARLKPGETVIMDAGTTTMELARIIPHDMPLTVITNALNVASCLMLAPKRHVIVMGGSLSPEIVGTLGPLAEQHLSTLVADKLFLSAQAVDPDVGITDVSPDVARIKQAMIAAAREVILIADSSKWKQTATARVAPMKSVHAMIMDDGLPAADAKRLSKLGVVVQRV